MDINDAKEPDNMFTNYQLTFFYLEGGHQSLCKLIRAILLILCNPIPEEVTIHCFLI